MLAANQREGKSSVAIASMRSTTRVLVVLCLFSTLHFMTPAAFATKISMPTLLRDGYPDGETRAVGVSSIPTLSEWGVIMMAGLMGLAGLIVTVRRQRAMQSN